MPDLVLYILLGAVIGFLIGLTGVGGGVLTVPSLIVLVGLPPITAVGTASFYAVLTKLYAVYRHWRQQTVNWRAGIKFFCLSLPGLILTSVLVKYAKSNLPDPRVALLQDAIGYIIMLSIAFSIFALLFDYSKLEQKTTGSSHGRILAGLAVFLIGAVMGATSIGGGVLIIPALLMVFRETKRYVGTSIFISVLLMIVMSAIYAFIGQDGKFGDVDVGVGLFMALGSLVGTHMGSGISKKIEPGKLQYVVIAVIAIAIMMMLADKLNWFPA